MKLNVEYFFPIFHHRLIFLQDTGSIIPGFKRNIFKQQKCMNSESNFFSSQFFREFFIDKIIQVLI